MSKRLRITKLEELVNAEYPNNKPVGYTKWVNYNERSLSWWNIPTIGERFWVGWGFSTSPVQEIIDENTFKTYNSIYKWEIYEAEDETNQKTEKNYSGN